MVSDYHINIIYSDEDGAYIADIPDLEACSALGQTPEQALGEVERAKHLWLEAARASGKPVCCRSLKTDHGSAVLLTEN
jgi:predicted RNase H-like HicB family nuclease